MVLMIVDFIGKQTCASNSLTKTYFTPNYFKTSYSPNILKYFLICKFRLVGRRKNMYSTI